MPATAMKRQNFDVTPEQDAEITWLRDALGASTAKDAILRAVRIADVPQSSIKLSERPTP